MGYSQRSGGSWDGDLIIADYEEIDTAEHSRHIHPKRFKAKEIEVMSFEGEPIFPLALGTCHQPGRQSKASRKPPVPPQRPQTTTEAEDISSRQQNTRPPLQPDYWELTSELLIRHHTTARQKLFIPSEADCPLPLDYIDVIRMTKTDIEDQEESRIEDTWNIHGPQPLSVPWKGTTSFSILRPKPPTGKMWVMGRLTRRQRSTRPPTIYPEIWVTFSRKDKQIKEQIYLLNKLSLN